MQQQHIDSIQFQPAGRSKAAISVDGDNLYVFGDENPPKPEPDDDDDLDEAKEDPDIREPYFDRVWRFNFSNQLWTRLEIRGAEANYPNHKYSFACPGRPANKHFVEMQRDLQNSVCAVNSSYGASPVAFLSFRVLFEETMEDGENICRFFISTLDSSGEFFVQQELPFECPESGVYRAFTDYAINFFGWPLSTDPTHFYFLYPEEFRIVDGEQKGQTFAGFDIFEFGKSGDDSGHWQLAKISDHANQTQLQLDNALCTAVHSVFEHRADEEDFQIFAFTNYIGFLRLKWFCDAFPLDKIVLFDTIKCEYSVRALAPDPVAGIPMGMVPASRLCVAALESGTFELHMPGGLYPDIEAGCKRIYEHYWILDLSEFIWRRIENVSRVAVNYYSTAYCHEKSMLCVFGGRTLDDYNSCSWPPEYCNRVETIQLHSHH